MGFIQGLAAGTNLGNNYRDRQRQAAADQWQEEERARTRTDWENQDSQRAGLSAMIESVRNSPNSEAVDPRAELGLGSMETPAQSAYAQRQGFDAPVGADVQTPGLAPAPAAKNSPYLEAQNKMNQQRLDMAKAVGGKEGAVLALDTGEQMRKAQLAESATRLADTIQNLRPQEYEQVLKKVTADSGNKYEATVDPVTGITTLKLGDSRAQLTRAQAGQYFAAKYRLKQGDPNAIADLEKIDAGLAAKVAAEFKSLRDTANDGNKVAYQNATLDVREKGLEQRERLAAEANKTKVELAAAKAAATSAGKPLPISAAKGILENQANLRQAQKALALVNGESVDGATGDTDATGWKGLMPNQVLNRMDAKGVDTRAAIADLGSLVIHDRSGAAVTAAEFPRLAPFIPSATDDAATVKKKLGLFTKNYQAIVDDAAEFYRSSGYNVPTEVLKSGKSDAPLTQKQTVPASGAVEGGYKFMGGDPADPKNWKRAGS